MHKVNEKRGQSIDHWGNFVDPTGMRFCDQSLCRRFGKLTGGNLIRNSNVDGDGAIGSGFLPAFDRSSQSQDTFRTFRMCHNLCE